MRSSGIFLTAVLCSTLSMGWTAPQENHKNALVQSVNRFSMSLYQAMRETPGNLVVSPFSVNTVLAMLQTGLRGQTADQVSAALHLPQDRAAVQQGFRSLLQSLQSSGNVSVEVANKIYVQQGFRVKQEYRDTTEQHFLAATEELDMQSETEAARRAINSWAAERTHNKIQDLLNPGDISADSVMVLLNAIYFKGLWEHAFGKDNTKDEAFHIDSTSTKNVPTMHITDSFVISEFPNNKGTALKLPYQGGKYSMLILLPHEVDGLSELEANIHTLVPSLMASNKDLTEVAVSLPKFKVTTTTNLQAPLTKLGLGGLFEGGDFSGISDQSNLAVSKAVQKALIQVDEEGTEATAASAVGVMLKSARVDPRATEFKVDHPFMFMISDDTTGAILFQGRVTEPAE